MFSFSAWSKKLLPLAVGAAGLALVGCGGDAIPEEVSYDWTKPSPAQILAGYHQVQSDQVPQTEDDKILHVYQDFSDGFQQAWKNPNSMEFYRLFVSSLKISSAQFYVVGEKSLDLIAGISERDLFARVTNPKSYNRNYASLDTALNEIVSHNRRSIFITDGELFSKSGESQLPWAKNGFTKWLKDGNKLSFYVTDFIEKGKKKHVFYMIFTPASEIGTETDITRSVEYALKNTQIPGAEIKYSSFHFQNNAYSLEKGFPAKVPGSLNGDLEVVESNYAINTSANWEFVEVGLGWADIYKYFVENALDERTGKPIDGGNPIIGQRENHPNEATMALNASTLEFYRVNSVKLRVTDIYDDFVAYAVDALCASNPQVMKKNANGEVEINPEDEQPVMLQEGEPGCYDGTGNLLSKYKYAKKPSKELNDVLVLNDKHFANTMLHNSKGEIEIQLSKKFDGTSLSAEHENLLKLELIVDDVQPVSFEQNPNLQNFIWEGQKIPTNKAMYESVMHALFDAMPKGKVLYTWYIKTPANDF